MNVIFTTLMVLLTAPCMEPFARLMHRYVMHGFVWGWHQSHHRPRGDKNTWFECNDLYALVFATFAIALIAFGVFVFYLFLWMGYGMTLYGLIYFFVHDTMVHQRWPLKWIPRRGYLKSLYQCHRLHHASTEKSNAVSPGSLYISSAHLLKQKMQSQQLVKTRTSPAPQDKVIWRA